MKRFWKASHCHWRRSAFLKIAAVVAVWAFSSGNHLHAAPKRGVKKPESATSAPAAKPLREQRQAVSDDLYEGSSTSKSAVQTATSGAPALKAGSSAHKFAAPLSPGPKYADAWPSGYRAVEGDLLLTQEAEDRAKAMAEFVRASKAEENGDADAAIESWKRAASLDPANPELAVKVAFELAKRNEPSEAIRILKDCIAVAPNEPKPRIYLAQVYAKHLNKVELALPEALKAVEVAPDFFPAWAAVVDLHQQRGDKKKAAEVLERATKSASKNPGYWMQLGGFLRKTFVKEDGATATPEELRQMEVVFRKAAELKPTDASVLTQVGDFFALAHNQKETLDFYERAVKLNQPARDEATKNLREKHVRALIANDRKAEALPLLEQLARDPSMALRGDLYEWLGELYEQTAQFEKAIEFYKNALVFDTKEPTNHLHLANMQLRAKRYAAAVTTLEKARKRFAGQPRVTMACAEVLDKAKRHAEAVEMFAKVVEEAKGNDDEVIDYMFYYEWGSAAGMAGQMDKAEEYFKRSISMNPEWPGAYNDLGFMWVDRGMNIEEAGEMIKKAVEMMPENAAYLDSLGWYYFKVGKFEDARRELLNAVSKLQQDDATVMEHLGDTLQKLGNDSEALKYWQRAQKLQSENPAKLAEKIEAAKPK